VFLKGSEIRPARKGRKRPRHGSEDNQQSYRKPDGHDFKFFGIFRFSFGFARTDADHRYRQKHHYAVLHAEKPDVSLMDSILEVMQKIVNDRADEVESQAQEKLDVHNGGRPMSDRMIY